MLDIQALSLTYPNAKKPAFTSINLQVAAGELLALVGESGSGKSSLLRSIAGLERPQKGQIQVQNTLLQDGKHFVAPEHRPVDMFFQDYALFPHLRVAQNVAYGLRKHPQAAARVNEVLSWVGMEAYGHRYPHELSGGQQQRVALARALAPEPALLLLDEPFSNLDTVLRTRMRDELRQILRRSGCAAILVTHDTQDALTVADRIAVLEQGQIVQWDTPNQVYAAPATPHVAQLFGELNILIMSSLPEACQVALTQKGLQATQIGVRPGSLTIHEIPTTTSIQVRCEDQGFYGAYFRTLFEGAHNRWIVYHKTPLQVNQTYHLDIQTAIPL